MTLLRAYAPDALGRKGYPIRWREINALICDQAGHRCERCGHPYRKGTHGNGEWSPCDEQCTHGGPLRLADGRPAEGIARAIILMGMGSVAARWRILTVHHLDNDKANCRWWNLAALCQRCHLTIQGRVRMAQVFPFEHSEWFKPHAAGYYAFTYLGEDLDREATLERLDELLGLEGVL